VENKPGDRAHVGVGPQGTSEEGLVRNPAEKGWARMTVVAVKMIFKKWGL